MTDSSIHFLVLCIALIGLIKSATWIISSAENTGKKLGISPFILGAILGFGTSLPELVTALVAVSDGGVPEIPVANTVGSNITMILLVFSLVFIFAISNLQKTVDIKRRKQHLCMFLLITVLFLFFAMDEFIYWYEGFLLLGVLFIYIVWLIKHDNPVFQKDKSQETVQTIQKHFAVFKDIFVLIAGSILILISSYVLVENIKIFAESISLSVDVISLVVLAIGTSVPDLAITITALTKRKSMDLIMGNIISTMIFNIGATVGFVALVMPPLNVENHTFIFGFPFLIFSSIIFFISLYMQKTYRLLGVAFLLLFVCFLYLITMIPV